MAPAKKNEKSAVGEDFAEIRGYIADIRGSIAGIHEKLELLDLIAQKVLGEDAGNKVEDVKKQQEQETLAYEDSNQIESHDDGFLKNINPIVGQIQPITMLERKTHRSTLNYPMAAYEKYNPQTQRTETPFSLLEGKNAGSKDRTVEPYFERGKDMVEDFSGFDNKTRKDEHQQGKENGSETEMGNCAHQVFDQMLLRRKLVTKKKKSGSTHNGSCDSTGFVTPCTKPHVKKQFHRARFKHEKKCDHGCVISKLQIQRSLGGKRFYQFVEARSTKNKPATKHSSSVQVWEPGGSLSPKSQLSWLERLAGVRILSKLELEFAKLPQENKTALKKLVKWWKCKFKHKQNIPKNITERFLSNQIACLWVSKLEHGLFRKIFRQWFKKKQGCERTYSRYGKEQGTQGAFHQLLQLKGITILTRKKIVAEINGGTYDESLKKPPRDQGEQHMRKVKCSELKRCKYRPWKMELPLLMFLVREYDTKIFMGLRKHKVRYKHSFRGSPWKHVTFSVTFILKLKYTGNDLRKWYIQKKQYLTRRKRAKFRKKCMKSEMKLLMHEKEKHAEMFPELLLSTTQMKNKENGMKLKGDHMLDALLYRSRSRNDTDIKATLRRRRDRRRSFKFRLEMQTRDQRLNRKRKETYGQGKRCKYKPERSDHINLLIQMKGVFKSQSMSRMKSCDRVKSYGIMIKFPLWKIRVKKKKSLDERPRDCSVLSLLVFYIITWAALEGRNKGLSWSDSDGETQAWKCLVIELKLTCLSGEDTLTHTICLLWSVFSWGAKNKLEQTEEVLDIGTAAGKVGERVNGIMMEELVIGVYTLSRLIEKEVLQLQADSEAEMSYQSNHTSGQRSSHHRGRTLKYKYSWKWKNVINNLEDKVDFKGGGIDTIWPKDPPAQYHNSE